MIRAIKNPVRWAVNAERNLDEAEVALSQAVGRATHLVRLLSAGDYASSTDVENIAYHLARVSKSIGQAERCLAALQRDHLWEEES